jgi:hypothetical protein
MRSRSLDRARAHSGDHDCRNDIPTLAAMTAAVAALFLVGATSLNRLLCCAFIECPLLCEQSCAIWHLEQAAGISAEICRWMLV